MTPSLIVVSGSPFPERQISTLSGQHRCKKLNDQVKNISLQCVGNSDGRPADVCPSTVAERLAMMLLNFLDVSESHVKTDTSHNVVP